MKSLYLSLLTLVFSSPLYCMEKVTFFVSNPRQDITAEFVKTMESSPLCRAVKSNDKANIKQLFDTASHIEREWSLRTAAFIGEIPMLELLISAGAHHAHIIVAAFDQIRADTPNMVVLDFLFKAFDKFSRFGCLCQAVESGKKALVEHFLSMHDYDEQSMKKSFAIAYEENSASLPIFLASKHISSQDKTRAIQRLSAMNKTGEIDLILASGLEIPADKILDGEYLNSRQRDLEDAIKSALTRFNQKLVDSLTPYLRVTRQHN